MKNQAIKSSNESIESEWNDDIDFEPYQNEKTYIPPESIDKETIAKIKQSSIGVAIKNMVDWDNVFNQAFA